MNDHNLDDLIIDSIEPNHSKTKSFLTIIALFIVFLIAGIILAKIYTKESNNATLTLEENNSEMIAPELKLQAPSKVAKVKEKPSLSTIMEPEIKAPEVKAPEVKRKEAVPVQKPVNPVVTQKPVKTPKETVQITQDFTKKPQKLELPEPITKVAELPKPVKIVVIPKEIPKPIKAVVIPKVISKPIKTVVVPKAISKPVKTVVVPKNLPKQVAVTTYYIQVGSFTKSPSTRFLSVIKNSGFNYTITKATAKGTKKLLIGPYLGRAAVDTALIQVRDRINKKSFVVKK